MTKIRQGTAKNKINESTYLVTSSLSTCSRQKKQKQKPQELIRPRKQKWKIDLAVRTIQNTKQKNNNQPTSQNDPDTAYSRDVPAKKLKEKRRQKSEGVQQKTKINKWTYLRKWTWTGRSELRNNPSGLWNSHYLVGGRWHGKQSTWAGKKENKNNNLSCRKIQ